MVLKKTLIVGSLLASMACCGTALGQTYTPSADFEHRAIERPDNTGPLVSPGVFNYDAQMFAPVEFTNDKELEPNTGFFFSVDKVLTSVSLPRKVGTGLPINGTSTDLIAEGDLSNVSPNGNDWTWGERYSFGWMGEDDHGWEGSFQDQAGQSSYRTRMDANLDSVPNTLIDFFVIPTTLSTTYRVGELNRVFRQVLKNGDTFEPYLGGRYTQLGDVSNDIYDTAIFNTDINGDGNIDAPDEDLNAESQLRQVVSNSALGFQLGGRHRRRRGRFLYTTDGSLAVSHNRQRYTAENYFVLDQGAAAADDAAAGGSVLISTDEYHSDSTFVPSIDLEYALSYNVTRDLTIRLGTQFTYLWQNVARANTAVSTTNANHDAFFFENENSTYRASATTGLEAFFDVGEEGLFNDDFIAAGFTFGVEWRR